MYILVFKESSIVIEAIRTTYLFIFFMKRLIHANKTQGYLYILPPHAFFKDLSTNIKNNVYSLVGLAYKNKNI